MAVATGEDSDAVPPIATLECNRFPIEAVCAKLIESRPKRESICQTMLGNALRKLLRLGRLSSGVSYREWWNSVSGTMADAYASTIDSIGERDYQSRGWHGDTNSYGAKHFIEKCRLTTESKVLEIGCGVARIGRELAPHVAEWHGADISTNMLAHARQRCAGLRNVYLHELSGMAGLRALPSLSFDFIYATIVFMHLDKEDVFEYLRQAYRMLKTGCCAYFDTWNILHPDVFRIWNEAAVVGDGKPRGRVQCSSPAEFRVYLEQAGFRVTQFDETGRLIRAFCAKDREDVPPIADDCLPPFGYLCFPENEQMLSGKIRIEGWAMDHIRTVEVLVDGDSKGLAELGHHRPEVPPLFGRYAPECERCGYVLQLDTTTLANGGHEITVLATDNSGRTTALTGQHHGFVVENLPQPK